MNTVLVLLKLSSLQCIKTNLLCQIRNFRNFMQKQSTSVPPLSHLAQLYLEWAGRLFSQGDISKTAEQGGGLIDPPAMLFPLENFSMVGIGTD